MTFIVQIL